MGFFLLLLVRFGLACPALPWVPVLAICPCRALALGARGNSSSPSSSSLPMALGPSISCRQEGDRSLPPPLGQLLSGLFVPTFLRGSHLLLLQAKLYWHCRVTQWGDKNGPGGWDTPQPEHTLPDHLPASEPPSETVTQVSRQVLAGHTCPVHWILWGVHLGGGGKNLRFCSLFIAEQTFWEEPFCNLFPAMF